jgi:type II secretory pathway predicted ATPase ExeA
LRNLRKLIDLYFPASAIETSRQTLTRCIERAEGPGLLVGGPGTGKSLMCALLADQFRTRFHLIKLDHARFCTRRALLQAVMFELNLPYRGLDEGELRLALIDFAKSPDSHREGLLLVVDEAQTLPARLIEEVRMISNVVIGGQPRLRLVLSGNADLEERLTSPKLESFNQRIAARCYLQPLNYDETASYVQTQIAVAGSDAGRLFEDNAWQAVYHASGGIPRLINQICDHALMLAAAARRPKLDAAVIEEAWADLQQLPLPWPTKANASSTRDETVIEFGSLETDDDETETSERPEIVQRRTPDPCREVIDLTSQLDQIELHVAEWDSAEVSEPDSVQQTPDQAARTVAPASAVVAALASDPFNDSFEEEEAVQDPYSALEAQARIHGKTTLSPQEHEFAAALQGIFQPFPGSDHADHPTAAAGSEPLDAVMPPVVEQAVEEPGDELPATAAGEVETDETGDSEDPATFQVEALRVLPPDDSDLILVLDAESHVSQLSRTPGKAHRQEYRHLFTRLRES